MTSEKVKDLLGHFPRTSEVPIMDQDYDFIAMAKAFLVEDGEVSRDEIEKVHIEVHRASEMN